MADKDIVGALPFAGGGSVDLTSSNKTIVGALAFIAGGAVNGVVGGPKLIVSTLAFVAGGAAAGALAPQISGRIEIVSDGTATLSTSQAIRGAITITSGGEVRATVDGQGLLVADAVKAVTELWGIGCCGADIDECVCNTIIGYINSAHQMIYSHAAKLDYFNKTTLDITITANTSTEALSQSVQTLLGPVRRTDTRMPLSACQSIDELDNFVDYYYGGSAPEEPRAYYLNSKNQSNSDNVALTLHVTPAPSVDTALQVDASLEPPRYTCDDSRLGTPLQMPHKYVELLLLPLVRKWATANSRFSRREMQKEIDEQFAIAQQTLGMIEPETPAVRKTKAKE